MATLDWKCILAAVSPTDRSTNALREAVRLSHKLDVPLHVLHVVEGMRIDPMQEILRIPMEQLQDNVRQDAESQAKAMLAEIAESITPSGTANVEIRFGPASEQILERLSEVESPLLVMARNSESKPQRGAGTVAVQCVRHAETDVLLVREAHEGRMKSIVACVDFSDASSQAILEAAAIAEQDGADLHILHIYYPPWDVVYPSALPVDTSSRFQDEYQGILHNRLTTLAKEVLGEEDEERLNVHVIAGISHAAGIVHFLEEHHSDLAVIASSGRTGIKRFLLGSTAERVIRDAPCSVLTIKRGGKSGA